MKKASEKSIVMKVKNEVQENIAMKTKKMNNSDKLLSLNLLFQRTSVIAHGLDFPVVGWPQLNK